MAGAFLDDDLADVFDTEEFAVEAFYHPRAGDPVPGVVIPDEPQLDVLEQITVNATSCVFPTSQWPDLPEESLLVYGGQVYALQRASRLTDGRVTRAYVRQLSSAERRQVGL